MIDLHAALRQLNGAASPVARMILTVHDELVIESQAAAAEEVAGLVRAHMSGAAQLAVPLDVDVGIGENWKDAKS
jgi:DNA polymerase-1